MVHSSFVKRIKRLIGVFLLCVSVSCVYGASPAHAEDSGAEGVSGSCVWKYEPISTEGQNHSVNYKLTISPSLGSDLGILGRWEDDPFSLPPWQDLSCRKYRSKTTSIKIAAAGRCKPVKAFTCVNMFKDFTALGSADLLGLDVTGATNMNSMFSGCRALVQIELKEFDTSSVRTMSCMFKDCQELCVLYSVAEWNTSNVVDMSYMFCGCSSLLVLDLREWSTSSNPKMMGMFDTYGPSNGSYSDESLLCLHVGEKFHFGEFSDARISDLPRSPLNDKRFHWIQVDYDMGGTSGSPKGKEFVSFDHVVAFHNNRAKGSGLETYVRSGFGEFLLVRDDGTIPEPRVRMLSMQVPELIGESDVEGSCTQESSAQGLSTQGLSTQESSAQESSVHSFSSAGDSRVQEPSIQAKQGEITGWYKCDNMVFYGRDKEMLTGWQELAGTIQNPSSLQKSWFYFNGAGVMLTGRQNLVGGFKNAQGIHESNEFFFDTTTGAEIRGWHKIVEDGVERWYYYRDGDGIMLKGQHELVGGFNQCMNWFYFDEATGIQIRGWKYIDYQDKWCYYSGEDGTMLKGQYRLYGGDNGGMNWFYFDEVTGAELRNCWKEIPSQSKTCYYGSDGAMYKGWREVAGRRYYFDEVIGALT